jgi:hypothetical protein
MVPADTVIGFIQGTSMHGRALHVECATPEGIPIVVIIEPGKPVRGPTNVIGALRSTRAARPRS